jgi:hypothetical protein
LWDGVMAITNVRTNKDADRRIIFLCSITQGLVLFVRANMRRASAQGCWATMVVGYRNVRAEDDGGESAVIVGFWLCSYGPGNDVVDSMGYHGMGLWQSYQRRPR